eukprot:TRINITY_DN6618_c0_g1_i1.p1 TRINITY_DN6618_c0_g1~~TRINITY_DN6618_c0_g1_i1.p1  ORF type:complete len:236 (-),score=67.40 TRINITY_DN6618_c0_g1_i1:56-763(-)
MSYNFANTHRPKVQDGLLSITSLLRDPLYHETFSKIQNDKFYSKNWNLLLSPCDELREQVIECSMDQLDSYEAPECKLLLQKWFVCATKQIDINKYTNFQMCLTTSDNLEECLPEYEECCDVVKETKERYETEWQLTDEEMDSLYDCTGLMDKSNRATEKFGPSSEQADVAFGNWLDCFVKKTCKEQYNEMLKCIKVKGNQNLCIEEGHSLIDCSSRMTLRYGNSMSLDNQIHQI